MPGLCTISVLRGECFLLLGRVCILAIKQIDNIKENFLWPFNKCVPILAIMWEFRLLTRQTDQRAILASVVSIIMYVTK